MWNLVLCTLSPKTLFLESLTSNLCFRVFGMHHVTTCMLNTPLQECCALEIPLLIS